MPKNLHRDHQKALVIEKIAEKRGLKKDTVRRILNGSRKNEDVMDDYVSLNLHIDNALLSAVKKLVPFHQN
jgi:hypothetical protein